MMRVSRRSERCRPAAFAAIRPLVATAIVVFAAAHQVFPVDYSPGLTAPTSLTPQQMSVWFTHRFYGLISEDPLTTTFGLSRGANVGIGARYAIVDRLTLAVVSILGQREFVGEAAWARTLIGGNLDAQVALEVFTFEELPGSGDWTAGALPYLSVRSGQILNRLGLIGQIGYDFLAKGAGFGFGADIGITNWLTAFVEFFPATLETQFSGGDNSFATGLMMSTYGHRFLIYTGNNPGLGTRRQMLGTDAYAPRLGFAIYRRFDFAE